MPATTPQDRWENGLVQISRRLPLLVKVFSAKHDEVRVEIGMREDFVIFPNRDENEVVDSILPFAAKIETFDASHGLDQEIAVGLFSDFSWVLFALQGLLAEHGRLAAEIDAALAEAPSEEETILMEFVRTQSPLAKGGSVTAAGEVKSAINSLREMRDAAIKALNLEKASRISAFINEWA